MSKEINLLPISRRRQLARRFLERQLMRFFRSVLLAVGMVTVGGVAAIVFLQLFGTVLFDSVSGELDDAVVVYRVETKAIQDTNQLLKEMKDKHEERLVWSDLFDDVLSTLPAGTRLEEMRGVAEGRRVELRGQATARSSLIVMEEKLKGLPWVMGVEAPNSNLLDRDNPKFTFFLNL